MSIKERRDSSNNIFYFSKYLSTRNVPWYSPTPPVTFGTPTFFSFTFGSDRYLSVSSSSSAGGAPLSIPLVFLRFPAPPGLRCPHLSPILSAARVPAAPICQVIWKVKWRRLGSEICVMCWRQTSLFLFF